LERTEAPAFVPARARQKQRPPMYRVLLHNDDHNERNYVVKVIVKVVGLAPQDAFRVMDETDSSGCSEVIVCAQEEAEEYCDGLRKHGLTSSIEPVSGGDGGGEGAA
jgi:ATP-dependent Clp protease adaptor protein ClpS